MDISILTPDGKYRMLSIVADDLDTAASIFPDSICVERGSDLDLAAVDLVLDSAATMGPGIVEEFTQVVKSDPTMWDKFKTFLGFGG